MSETWVYKLHLLGRNSLAITGVASGTEYTFTADTAATGNLTPGNYRWVIRASKASEIYEVCRGSLVVLEQAAVADNTDVRSFNEKMRDALRALVLGATNTVSGIEQYQIHGRMIVYMKRTEQERWLNIYEMKVLMERNGGRLPPIETGFRGA